MRLERSFSFWESGARAHAWLLTTNVAHTTYHINPTIKWCHPQNLHVSYCSSFSLNKKNLYVGASLVICQSKSGYFVLVEVPRPGCTVWPISDSARSRRFGSKPPHWCQNSGPSWKGKKGRGATLGSGLVGVCWMSKIPRWWENMSGGTKEIFGGWIYSFFRDEFDDSD